MRRARAFLAIATAGALGLLTWASPLHAQANVGDLHLGATAKHGQNLGSEIVGPRAFEQREGRSGRGHAAAKAWPGLTIRDETTAPFLRRIDNAAVYDGFTVPGPHLLIANTTFSGPLDIYARQPLVLRGATVRMGGASHWAVLSREGAGALYFLWSSAGGEPDMPGLTAAAKPGVQRGLYLASDNAVVYRSHISRAADGIQVHAPGARIIETVIDDLVTWDGEHNDGIQLLGRGERLTLQRSRIVNVHPQTSCLLLQGGGHRIEDNFLSGGGWVIYGGATLKPPNMLPARDIQVHRNVFGQGIYRNGGHFGPVADWDAAHTAGNVWRDNRLADGTVVGVPPGRAKR